MCARNGTNRRRMSSQREIKQSRKQNGNEMRAHIKLYFNIFPKTELQTNNKSFEMCSVYEADELLLCALGECITWFKMFPWNSLCWIRDWARLRECNFVVAMETTICVTILSYILCATEPNNECAEWIVFLCRLSEHHNSRCDDKLEFGKRTLSLSLIKSSKWLAIIVSFPTGCILHGDWTSFAPFSVDFLCR